MAEDTAPHSANSAQPRSASGRAARLSSPKTELAEVSTKPDELSPPKPDELSPPKPDGLSPSKPEPGEPAVALNIAVLTVSDTRTRDNDTSGDFLADAVVEAGHKLADRALIADDVYRIRALLSQWIASEQVQVALVTGGTGFSGRDSTPEAVRPLLDKHIDGFGEVFRSLSLREIGSSTLQSRACAGLANRTAVFCMPGSTGACRTAWRGILRDQLDSRHRPCNFVAVLQGRGPHSASGSTELAEVSAEPHSASGRAARLSSPKTDGLSLPKTEFAETSASVERQGGSAEPAEDRGLSGSTEPSANSAEPFTPATAPRDGARDSLRAGSATRAAEP